MDWDVILRNLPFLLMGLQTTFKLAIVAVAGAFPLGILLGLSRLSSKWWLYYPASAYVHLIRSVPLILVIFWFFFLMPIITGRPVGSFASAAVAFIIFEAAYFAEIVRAGIQSISKGQVMAGLSTGLSYISTMRHIVLPQAIRNMIPVLVTQVIVLFQDTSLAYVIGVREFLRWTSLVDAREFRSIELYATAAVVYFIICFVGSTITRRLEKKGGRLR